MSVKQSGPKHATKARWVGLFLIFCLTFIGNLDRSNLGVSTSTMLKEINMTPVEMGIITSVFSLAYAAMQIPGSLFVRRVGTRVALTVAVVLWSVFTLLTGFANGFISLLIVRMIFGFAEAPLYPGANEFNYHWFPRSERAFANSFPNAGSFLALIITPPLAVWVLETLGLRWVFGLSSLVGLVGALLWYVYTRNTPAEHPSINQAELQYIISGKEMKPQEKQKVPWGQMFSSRSFWALCITYFASVYQLQFFVYWLPFYLQNQLHMSLKSMGFAASLPWVFIFIATLFVGRISDFLFKKRGSLFIARNMLILIGFLFSGIAVFLSTITQNPWGVVLLLSIALGFIGFNMTIPWSIATDIGAEYTGVISSAMNTCGQIGAAIMATVTALVGTYFGWNSSLITLVIVALIGIFACLMIRPDQKIYITNKNKFSERVSQSRTV
jgi:ACS family glucarate transporter-like MFS transporter